MREAAVLREGGVGVIATDTLYGLVAAAANEEAVRRVYKLKNRAITKQSIVLISSLKELAYFGIGLTEQREQLLTRYWPGPTSIVMPCGTAVPEYLQCGTHTLAFRLPSDEPLRAFIHESGPLIAPSANPEGQPPATTIEQAREYFGDTVDFYVDGGERSGEPSTLIALSEKDEVTVLRKGRL